MSGETKTSMEHVNHKKNKNKSLKYNGKVKNSGGEHIGLFVRIHSHKGSKFLHCNCLTPVTSKADFSTAHIVTVILYYSL